MKYSKTHQTETYLKLQTNIHKREKKTNHRLKVISNI